MQTLLEYLSTRRSSLSLTLEDPGPTEDEIRDIVTLAARVPDHGKLAPWRFEHWSPEYRQHLFARLSTVLDDQEPLQPGDKRRGATEKLLHGPVLIAVISTAGEHPKIPEWEQILSAGASCMSLLMAANAMGYEAQWLTAWYCYENEGVEALDLKDGERIAGLIHIGSSSTAKSERPRPSLDDILSRREVN